MLARHSCSAEYWRPRNRSEGEDDDDTDGRSGRSFAPQRRSLFQWLRCPADKGRSQERSPRRERGESSRQGGHHHNRDRSLSPAMRRSRERSLDRLIHRFQRCGHSKQPELNDKKTAWPLCKRPPTMPEGSSESSGAASASVLPRVTNAEVDAFLFPNRLGLISFIKTQCCRRPS
jgi:hypothetical protein